jgi:3-isopropylmalate/(R)-2-methylmalate dehydratase large subunit
MMPRTLFEKIRDLHVVSKLEDGAHLIAIDRIMLHERTGSIALSNMLDDGRELLRPEAVFSTIDHIVDTAPGRPSTTRMPGGQVFVDEMRRTTKTLGLGLFDVDDSRQGIVHVIAPEQGIALPGITMVCPDSHTCTLGALGALAWGIGSTECEHALATGTLRLPQYGQIRFSLTGQRPEWIGPKDIILHLIAKFGAGFGKDHVIEFAGPAVADLSIEERLTLCNMGVEFGAFTVIIAPDEKTIEYVAGRANAPRPADQDAAVAHWKTLASDRDAKFDLDLTIDVSSISPTISWGTSADQSIAIDADLPTPESDQHYLLRAIDYMGLTAGAPLLGVPIDGAFIGSCTNSRLSDLQRAANILNGRKLAVGVRGICVPGSTAVKLAAEAEGLDLIFKAAGFEWQEAGCAMCFYAGGETFTPKSRVVSSTNRSFEGRQGPGVRTHITSPETVAWSAICGEISDLRKFPS